MGRPLTGSCKQLDTGVWRASLPTHIGSRQRTTPTFEVREDAERWLADGVVALKSGEPLPDPDGYRRKRTVTHAVAGAQVTLETLLDRFHASRYERDPLVSPDRKAAVLSDYKRHVLPFFRARGLTRVADLCPRANPHADELISDWLDWLGGWPGAIPGPRATSPTAADDPEVWLTRAELVERVGRSRSTVDRWIKQHDLQPVATEPGTRRRLFSRLRRQGRLA
jgi:hypothetical protein